MLNRWCIFSFVAFILCCGIPAISATAEDDEQYLPDSTIHAYDFSELEKYRDEKGLKNLDPHSVILTRRGIRLLNEDRTEEAIQLLNGARMLSPDLPLSYLYLAKAHFFSSQNGLYTTSSYLLDSWKAFWNNFWWSFQTSGTLVISLYFSFYVSLVIFIAVLIALKLKLYVHDLVEDKRKILLLLPSLVLVFLGPVFGLVGFLLPFWVYMKKRERFVLYCCFILLLMVVILLPFISSFLGAPGNRIFRDIVRINNGIYTGEALAPPTGGGSFEPLFLYALDKKRNGYYNEAISMYKELLNQRVDARIYNNLGNSYIGLGDYESALEYYKKALKLSKKALIYYNISQLYREIFNFEEAEKYYDLAVNADPFMVNVYNSAKGTSVNSLVMDETLSAGALWDLGFERNFLNTSENRTARIFFFTSKNLSFIMLFLLILSLYLYGKTVARGAYRCRRCGDIFCGKCEKKVLAEDICHTCFKTLVKVSELKSKDRIERILEIQQYRENRGRYLKMLTLLVPGSGHIYFGWPALGFSLLLLFSFFLSSSFLWFYFPVPVAMTQTATVAKFISIAGLVLVYGLSAERVLRRIPQKWL